MPSSSEHDAPLSLVCGNDTPLSWLVRALAVAAVVVVVAGGLSAGIKALLVLFTVTLWSIMEYHAKAEDGRVLRIFPSGRTTFSGRVGRIRERAWVSRGCVVISLEATTIRPVVISASRQRADEYRKLRVWLRHQRCCAGHL
jgi:hypothetical protein